MTRVLSVSARVYRAAVHLYPPDFRREFIGEMTQDFVEGTQEAWREGYSWRVAKFWAHLTADFMRSVPVQWLRGPRLAIALVPAMVTLMGIAMAAQIAPLVQVDMPAVPADRDLLALLLLVTVFLLIVVATIVLTPWLTRSLRQRPRL
jgi:hypothetical protein